MNVQRNMGKATAREHISNEYKYTHTQIQDQTIS